MSWIVRWSGTSLACLAVLGGCGSLLPAREPDPVLHMLAPPPVAMASAGKRDVVLEVAVPRAAPGFDTSHIVYVQRPYELEYFARHRWAEAPARMLAPLLTQALERSGGFRAVVQAPTAVPADVRIVTELVRLQQDFATRPSRVEFALRVQLVDVHARRVLATRTFDDAESAPTDDAHGGVTAANAAVARVLTQVVDFSVAETSPRPVPVPK